MFKEFKQFALRGNVVDMAVGIIIGTAFGGIVNSLVNDVLMPPLGMLIGMVDFSHLAITLHEKTGDFPAVTLKYGVFLNAIINFLIVTFSIFMLVRQMNRLLPPPAAPLATKECRFCCSNIPIKAVKCPQCISEL